MNFGAVIFGQGEAEKGTHAGGTRSFDNEAMAEKGTPKTIKQNLNRSRVSLMRVGILGGGQLGLMLAESVAHLGHHPLVFERDSNSPCHQRLANTVTGHIENQSQLAAFCQHVDVVTFDTENIPALGLVEQAAKLRPSLAVLECCQDRVKEKTFLRDHHFHPVDFRVVEKPEQLPQATQALGFPCVAKTIRGGYDGKGQTLLNGPQDVDSLLERSTAPFSPLLLEAFVSLQAEVSCIVARDARGQLFPFPVFENLHRAHILDFTLVPARIAKEISSAATSTACEIAETLGVVGLLTVEFFVAGENGGSPRLYVNELAPRPHNSGHVTRSACSLSQFDALARILTETPMVAPQLRPGGHCMGQLLGEVWHAQGRADGLLDLAALQHSTALNEVYLYGKRESPLGRKMGHFLVQAETADNALRSAQEFRSRLTTPGPTAAALALPKQR